MARPQPRQAVCLLARAERTGRQGSAEPRGSDGHPFTEWNYRREALKRASLDFSRSIRRQATTRAAKRTGAGNCAVATNR